MNIDILKQINCMFPCEFEEWRERGDNERHSLTAAVMQLLATPAGWNANGEYRTEFGGLFPVQVRYTPPDEQFSLCICSPGEVSATWLAVLISEDGRTVRSLLSDESFAPARINMLLDAAGNVSRMDYSISGVVAYLAEGIIV